MGHLVQDTFEPFSSSQWIVASLCLSMYVIAFVGHSILGFLWWQHREQDNDLFAVFIIVCDWFASLTAVDTALNVWLGGYHTGSLAFGEGRCIYLGMWHFSFSLTTLFSIMLYAYQRYRIITQKPSLSLKRATWLVVGYLVGMFTVLGIPLMAGEKFVLAASKTYCLIEWSNRSPATLVVVVYLTIITIAILSTLVGFYGSIYKHIANVTRRLNELGGQHSAAVTTLNVDKGMFFTIAVNGVRIDSEIQRSPSHISELVFPNDWQPPSPLPAPPGHDLVIQENLRRQRTLVCRVIVMLGVCLVSFIPYLLSVLYQLFSGRPVSLVTDSIACVSSVANLVFDFIIFITVNTTYRKLFWEWWRRMCSGLRGHRRSPPKDPKASQPIQMT